MKYVMLFENFSGDVQETYPNVLTLGNGIHWGELAAHTFKMNGKKYYSENGIRQSFYTPWMFQIQNGVIIYSGPPPEKYY